MRFGLTAGLLIALSVQGAEFFTGQAARAVLGQSSFSSREGGITGTALTISRGKLFVADATGKLLTFDLSKIPTPSAASAIVGSNCRVCGFAPSSSIPQRVVPGTAGISAWGKSLVAIDAHRHRVLLWRDITARSAFVRPDVILQTGISEPISVAIDGERLFVGDAALHAVLVWNSLPKESDQAPDAKLGNYSAEGVVAADTLERPEALVSDGMDLFVADSVAHRILVFSPADFHLQADQITNSATLVPGALAGGTLVGISGRGLADAAVSAEENGSGPLPLKLAGVQVIFNGVALPLVSVTPQEVRAQLPYAPAELTAASLYVRTEHAAGFVTLTSAVPVTLASASPGLFGFAGEEPRPGIAFHNQTPVSQEQPANPGDVIKLWAAGLHVISDTKPQAGVPFASGQVVVTPVTASVNGQPAEVVEVTLPPTSIGIYEIQVRLPKITYPDGNALLTISEDGVSSNTVAISVAH